MGIRIADAGVAASAAITQVGAIAAAIMCFWRDIGRTVVSFVKGLFNAEARTTSDWRLSLAVVVGSIPIAVIGLALKHVIEGPLRSLWVVAAGLILWSGVMIFAERAATQARREGDIGVKDGVIIGL